MALFPTAASPTITTFERSKQMVWWPDMQILKSIFRRKKVSMSSDFEEIQGLNYLSEVCAADDR